MLFDYTLTMNQQRRGVLHWWRHDIPPCIENIMCHRSRGWTSCNSHKTRGAEAQLHVTRVFVAHDVTGAFCDSADVYIATVHQRVLIEPILRSTDGRYLRGRVNTVHQLGQINSLRAKWFKHFSRRSDLTSRRAANYLWSISASSVFQVPRVIFSRFGRENVVSSCKWYVLFVRHFSGGQHGSPT